MKRFLTTSFLVLVAGQTLERLLIPFNDGKSSIDLLEVTTLLGLSVNTAFKTIKAPIRNKGALIIERFKVYPEFVADDSDQLIFHGDWHEKSHFPTGMVPNVNHALLVVGAHLTGSNKMGGIELLVQNLLWKKPFVTIGYNLLRSIGVDRLLAVQPSLNFSTDNNSVDHVGMIQSRSWRLQAFSWDLEKVGGFSAGLTSFVLFE
jgi:hypothetical protein